MIGAMLHNKAADTWHPIIFRPAPLPSRADVEMGALRHRSWGHVTEGQTKDAAYDDLRKSCADNGWRIEEGHLFTWDGEGVPTATCWFAEEASVAAPTDMVS